MVMRKYCPSHKQFDAVVEKDVLFYNYCMEHNSGGIYAGHLVDVTDRCNLKCRYCYHQKKDSDIPIETILKNCLAAPGPYILTGGEPTLREDIHAVIEAVKSIGPVTLLTNGRLAALLEHTHSARLIIIDNGSSRETALMLDDFSEPLGERGLFISSDRNLGLVAAINTGLKRSDSDYAVIVRPHVLVTAGWLDRLLKTASSTGTGIVSPIFSGAGAVSLPPLPHGCSQIETLDVSFSTLLLKGEMRMLLGEFNPDLDGGEWCLRDYIRRAGTLGFRTMLTSSVSLECGPDQQFGSLERRREMAHISRKWYTDKWGTTHDYLAAFSTACDSDVFVETTADILDGARQGHRYTLLLTRRQAADFTRRGWSALHTGISIERLPLLMPARALRKRSEVFRTGRPDSVLLYCGEEAPAGFENTLPVSAVRRQWERNCGC